MTIPLTGAGPSAGAAYGPEQSLTLQPDATDGLDTFMFNAAATTNFGTDNRCIIGDLDGGANICRQLIKFDLSSIPAGSLIVSATLSLYLTNDTFLGAVSSTYTVYRQLKAWVEGQATWNIYSTGNNWNTAGGFDAADCEQTGIGARVMTTSETLNEFKDFTLDAALVQEMLTGGALTNNGFFIKGSLEFHDAYTFASSDHVTAGNRPKLALVYQAPL